jgi:anti-anti-sigma factor
MTTHAFDEVAVLKPQCELWEGPESDELERQLARLLSEGRRVVVDLAGTRFLTARALGLFADGARAAALHGGAIALCGAKGFERRLLRLTRLADALPVYATEEEAVRELRSAHAKAS